MIQQKGNTLKNTEITEENTMNAKTEKQIENLKNQTIGVEIEMNHITRERAAKLAADFFGTGRYFHSSRPSAKHFIHGILYRTDANDPDLTSFFTLFQRDKRHHTFFEAQLLCLCHALFCHADCPDLAA